MSSGKTSIRKKASFATPFVSTKDTSKSSEIKIITTSKNTRIVKPDYEKWIRNITPLSKVLDEHLNRRSSYYGEQEAKNVYIEQSFGTSDVRSADFTSTSKSDKQRHPQNGSRRDSVSGIRKCGSKEHCSSNISKASKCGTKEHGSSSIRKVFNPRTSYASDTPDKKKAKLQVLGTILKMKSELQMIREKKEKLMNKHSDSKLIKPKMMLGMFEEE